MWDRWFCSLHDGEINQLLSCRTAELQPAGYDIFTRVEFFYGINMIYSDITNVAPGLQWVN